MPVKSFPIMARISSFAGLASAMNASQNIRAFLFTRAPDMRKQPLSASPSETFFWIHGDVCRYIGTKQYQIV